MLELFQFCNNQFFAVVPALVMPLSRRTVKNTPFPADIRKGIHLLTHKSDELMYVNQTSAALQAYQPSSVNKTSASSTKTPEKKFEIISFESLLSENDKRTLTAMENFAKNNGILDTEMEDMRVAIAAEKLFAQKNNQSIPEIDKNMMGKILDGAGNGRISLSFSTAKLFFDNFEQVRGINIVA